MASERCATAIVRWENITRYRDGTRLHISVSKSVHTIYRKKKNARQRSVGCRAMHTARVLHRGGTNLGWLGYLSVICKHQTSGISECSSFSSVHPPSNGHHFHSNKLLLSESNFISRVLQPGDDPRCWDEIPMGTPVRMNYPATPCPNGATMRK